ncbi:class I SAM-dependent methyltransferase [Proteobacteria bacterium 005FR1]|nr:class I SAM-dependent methyltransferase [Proteobacteria bacterium 005FR1]
MTSASVDNSRSDRGLPASFIDALARKAIGKVFSQLTKGRLLLEIGNEVLEFGESHASPELLGKVVVHDASVFRDLVIRGSIGAGESYMRGAWSSPDLVRVIRVLVANMDVLDRMDGRLLNFFFSLPLRLADMNTRSGSKRNISAHYDLGNEFFELFLDRYMMYSSARYLHGDADLESASTHKLDIICRKLALKADDHLLEIGTGWGGMAIYAAKHYGCRVTTTTISKQQYEYARERVIRESLEDRVTVLCEDYRDLHGQYDKLVSIEMIEAVGAEFYPRYFRTCAGLLKKNGLMLIQAITIPDQRFKQYRHSTDFIRKYIFPGGCLPSTAVVAGNVGRHTDLQIIGMEDMTADYAATLREWRTRFFEQLGKVREQGYSEEFIRMWDFYLCYCEGGFAERVIGTAQFLMAKPDARFELGQ